MKIRRFFIAGAVALIMTATVTLAGAPAVYTVGTNVSVVAPVRGYMSARDLVPFDAEATYAQGDYVRVGNLKYMAATSPFATNPPSHLTGTAGGWLAIPAGSRGAVVITLHSTGPAYLAYGAEAEAGKGTVLYGTGSSETIENWQGDVRAVCSTGTVKIGVCER